jgi:ribose transport system permease protein
MHSSGKRSAANSLNLFARVLAFPELGVIIALIVVAGIFQSFNSVFLSKAVFTSIIQAVTFISIIGVGQAFLLIGGQFDLSVGAVAGLAAIASAKLMTSLGWSVPLALLGGILFGCALGAVNGFMVTRGGVPAFIQTLGMLFVAQGLIQVISGGNPVYPLPAVITKIGDSKFFFSLGWNAVIWILIAIGGDFFVRKTTWGRNLYVIGGNTEVAKIVGINVRKYHMACFIFAGGLAALSGELVMCSLAAGDASIGGGWELTVIAGTVVGGVSLFGGLGTVAGGVLGVLLIQCVQSGLITSGLSPNFQLIAVGTILVLAVFFDVYRRRFRATMKSSFNKESALLVKELVKEEKEVSVTPPSADRL